MYQHLIFLWLSRQIAMRISEKSQCIQIFRMYTHLVEHCLYICLYRYSFLSESTQYTNQAIRQIWTLKNLVIQRLAMVLCRFAAQSKTTLLLSGFFAWITLWAANTKFYHLCIPTAGQELCVHTLCQVSHQ